MVKKVLVTGGSGFIGSFIAERLIDKGYRVIVFDKLDSKKAHNLQKIMGHPNFEYVRGNVTDIGQLEKIITEDLNMIYHLSAIVGIKNYLEDPLNVINVNVLGTKNVLDVACKYKIRVLFTSTSEIYGNNPKVPWSEEDNRILGPTSVDRWSYSSSKAIAEHMVLGVHKSKELPVNIVRFFNVYGPRQNPILVVSQSIKKVINGEKPLLYDGGRQTRCFTYIADAVEATIKVAENKKSNGKIYNIGSNKESSIIEVLSIICKALGKDAIFEDVDTYEYFGNKYQDIHRRVPDVSKIDNEIGWRATTSLEEGIDKTIKWALENPWWYNNSLDIK